MVKGIRCKYHHTGLDEEKICLYVRLPTNTGSRPLSTVLTGRCRRSSARHDGFSAGGNAGARNRCRYLQSLEPQDVGQAGVACLSSCFPYGIRMTRQKLRQAAHLRLEWLDLLPADSAVSDTADPNMFFFGTTPIFIER